jgi:hypothetical protein
MASSLIRKDGTGVWYHLNEVTTRKQNREIVDDSYSYQTVKCVHVSSGIRNQESLCWRGPVVQHLPAKRITVTRRPYLLKLKITVTRGPYLLKFKITVTRRPYLLKFKITVTRRPYLLKFKITVTRRPYLLKFKVLFSTILLHILQVLRSNLGL